MLRSPVAGDHHSIHHVSHFFCIGYDVGNIILADDCCGVNFITHDGDAPDIIESGLSCYRIGQIAEFTKLHRV